MVFNAVTTSYNFNPFGLYSQNFFMPYNNFFPIFSPFTQMSYWNLPIFNNFSPMCGSVFGGYNTQAGLMTGFQYGAMRAVCMNNFSCPSWGFNPFGNMSKFNFNFEFQKTNPSSTEKTDKDKIDLESADKPKGNEVKDGTSVTVSGLDYSIFGSDVSGIKQLRPEMQKKVAQLYKYAKDKGWKITLTSGFRSTEKQRRMYELWKAGKYNAPAVAAPGSSRHNFGCAVDLRINGKSSGPQLLELGRYAKTIGMRQGLSFHEQWHFDVDPKTTPKGTTSMA